MHLSQADINFAREIASFSQTFSVQLPIRFVLSRNEYEAVIASRVLPPQIKKLNLNILYKHG